MMYHGTLFYAVKSRSVGTFGRAKTNTIKIYRSSDSGRPACVLDQPGQRIEFAELIKDCGEDRSARDTVMAEFISFGG